MKRTLLLVLMIAMGQFVNAQTIDSDFHDGRIMFKLKNESQVFQTNVFQRDPNNYGLDVNLDNYPELKVIFDNYTITNLRKPSYFTRKPELMQIFRVQFQEFDKIDEIIEALKTIDDVEFAEKEPIYSIGFIPNDPQHVGNTKWYHTVVGSEDAWNISQGSSSVKVAIVDNAVFCGHSDLTTFAQYDVADNDNDATPPLQSSADFGWSHGTHCAGLATADINNGIGISSIGGNVELIGIKATKDASNSGVVEESYAGVQWACQNGANVVSMSFGGPNYSGSMQALINAYPDIVFLAAAGNDGNTSQQYPGAYNNVICVGSTNNNDSRSNFSNYNGATPFVDIAAPGGYSFGGLTSLVYTTGANSYAQMGGTSMATPFAAGLVGLMLSIDPTMPPGAIEACLISSGVDINQGIGPRINALAAIQCVQSGDPIPAFAGTPAMVIEGNTVNFADQSAGGGNAISNWNWSFPGGTPSSFVGQTPPPILYSTIGTYDVTIEVTNSQSTQTLLKSNYIAVVATPYGEWIPQVSGFSTASVGVNHISIVDSNTVWATGYDGGGGGSNLQLFTKTANGGNTWTPGTVDMQNTNLGLSMIHGLDNSTAWAVGYPNGAGQTGGVWKTTDGGANWTRQNSATFNNSASFTNVVHFWNANEGFCQGDPINGEFELYTTTDGGTNWTVVPGANIPNPENANEFGYVRQIEVVGDNVWYTTSTGRMYHSTDKGYNWVVYNTPVLDFGGAVTSTSTGNFSFSSATEGMIIDNNSVVYKTTNSGANWTTVATSGPIFTQGLCFIEGTNTAFSTGGGSSYSQDGGTTWSLIDTEQHLYVDFTDLNTGWSGWFNTDDTTGGMWKWEELPADLGINEIEFANFLLYPNPTSDKLHVSVDDQLIGNHFVVRNIIGQTLSEGTLLNGTTTIETESFAKGAYFFTIVEENATKKFIKD
jgi:photosystem II stability/assembly factor-like uncharacterized protein